MASKATDHQLDDSKTLLFFASQCLLRCFRLGPAVTLLFLLFSVWPKGFAFAQNPTNPEPFWEIECRKKAGLRGSNPFNYYELDRMTGLHAFGARIDRAGVQVDLERRSLRISGSIYGARCESISVNGQTEFRWKLESLANHPEVRTYLIIVKGLFSSAIYPIKANSSGPLQLDPNGNFSFDENLKNLFEKAVPSKLTLQILFEVDPFVVRVPDGWRHPFLEFRLDL